MATITGSNIVDLFYDAIDELQASSHFGLAKALRWLNDGIRELNRKEVLVEHINISLTASTRQYRLPESFIRELCVLYKGLPLARSEPHRFDWYSTGTGTPLRYFTIYPASVSAGLTPAVSPYIILDPNPSTTSTGTSPTFPGSGDAFLTVWYSTRHDNNFDSTNYTTKVLAMPEEIANGLADYMAMRAHASDGNPLVALHKEAWFGTIAHAERHRAWMSVHYPAQVRLVW